MTLKQLTAAEKTLLVYGAVHLAMQKLQEEAGGPKFEGASDASIKSFRSRLNRVLDLIEEFGRDSE